jgi:excisionase family DNA binding protein
VGKVEKKGFENVFKERLSKSAMKSEFELKDIEAIASKIVEALKPIIAANGRCEVEDIIFTPETLAEYLRVDMSWVYKQVSMKTIPYFKSGKYTRFKKSAIESWIQKQTIRPIPHPRRG